MLNANTTHVKILIIQVYYTNKNIIINFVGNDGVSKPREFFLNFCVRTRVISHVTTY